MMKSDLIIENGERPISATLFYGARTERAVIALHGFTSNRKSETVTNIAQVATADNAAVLSFDMPEHGDRRAQKGTLTVKNVLEDYIEVIKYVKEEVSDRISLFGSSMGGYFSLLAARFEPNIEQILLKSPALNPIKTLTKAMKECDNEARCEQLRKLVREITGGGNAYDVYELVKKYPYPKTDIIWGKKDEVVDSYDIKSFVAAAPKQVALTAITCGHKFLTVNAQKSLSEWFSGAFCQHNQ